MYTNFSFLASQNIPEIGIFGIYENKPSGNPVSDSQLGWAQTFFLWIGVAQTFGLLRIFFINGSINLVAKIRPIWSHCSHWNMLGPLMTPFQIGELKHIVEV
jgi:hypothetical protein